MSEHHQATHSQSQHSSKSSKAVKHSRPITDEDKHERKQRLQTHGRSSTTSSIADAVVVKDYNIFFLSKPDGTVPLGGEHGYGLYYHDCRFLSGYELKLGRAEPELLTATAEHGYASIIELTNPDVKLSSGQLIQKEQLGMKLERIMNFNDLSLAEVITMRNYGTEQIQVPLVLNFQADFEPLFNVRGLLQERPGQIHPPRWHDGHLCFFYAGADGIYRSLTIYFSPPPHSTDGTTAHLQFALPPNEDKQICISFYLGEARDQQQAHATAPPQPDHQQTKQRLQTSSNLALENATAIHSDSPLFNSIVDRSLRDLHMLKATNQGQEFFAAGVPWFVTLFGRDSIIAALQMLAYDPGIAEQTLRLLARYQGENIDEWRDEQPGKIMHELRVGELAHLNKIPQTPYYGTVDATPLFLILMAQHAAWTGTLTLFHDLRSHIERALEWIAHYGDQNGDGFVEYHSSSNKGLMNQGWKDSGDAIVTADGKLATPPISLVEVQGYVYLAKMSIADMYAHAGETDRATQLRHEAQELRTRFNRAFWLEDQHCYALALQADDKPAAVISSNPGQALWTGIVDPEKAWPTVTRLMAEDMFSGWGVRTLSEKERRYNPIGYHLGTVWPHDNSLIAAGFRRYGFYAEADRIFTGIVEAASHFAHRRLPEVFAGFRKAEYGIPVRYPVACHPQAWAAGAIPFLLSTSLGLVPDAFAHRLRIVHPTLPDFLQHLEVQRLRVGSGHADLHFERNAAGKVSMRVVKIDGQLDIAMEEDSNKGSS